MASQYEAYKVRELVTAYRSNPTMFTDDQLDQLEELAYNNDIDFKRINSEFNLSRAVRNAFAGAVEGFTTFDLIPETPRNTGEAIFRQLGHLVGFAPGIAKAPILAASKVARRITGDTTRNRFTQAALDHIDILATKSVPMQFSRAGQYGLGRVLEKTGLESAGFLQRGTVGRQIADEAVGLGYASAISNIWKGEDAVMDGFIGGAIAGGAFGGIGNFVSLGNLYKGTPQQVERANQVLRAGVGSLVTGLPSTLADEPTEMQLYNYLLGGFFGYKTRPAVDREASTWYNKDRNPAENFRPEESKDWNSMSKEAQDYIRYEHPMGYESSNSQAGGSAGIAFKYLNRKSQEAGQNINWRDRAIQFFNQSNKNYTERDILDYYRQKAMQQYNQNRKVLDDAVVFRNNVYNSEQLDRMDIAERDRIRLKNTSKKLFKQSDKFPTDIDVTVAIDNLAKGSDGSKEQFMLNIQDTFGKKAITQKIDRELRSWFDDKLNIMQPIDLPFLDGNSGTGRIDIVENKRIQDVTIREKAPILPIQKLAPEADIRYMTHVVLDNQTPIKLLEQKLNRDNKIEYAVGQDDLLLLKNVLAENNRYIYSANKDKLNVFTSNFRDDNYTLDDIFNIFTRSGLSLEEIQQKYQDALELQYDMVGSKSDAVANLFQREFISNVVTESQLEGIPVEESYRFIQEDSPYLKNVIDFNKRMQLPTARMTYMEPASFKDVAGTNNGESYNVILVNDLDLANQDGHSAVRNDFMDARVKTMGLDPKATGFDKPVVFTKTDLGAFAQKTSGQTAAEPLDKFMRDNNIHEVVWLSSAKRKGNLPITELTYGKDGKWSSENIQPITLPTNALQISTGTRENNPKDISGTDIVLQFYNQINNTQGTGFAKVYFENVLRPSLQGTKEAQELVETFNKNEDVDAFVKEFNEKKLTIHKMPMNFMIDKLQRNPNEPVSIFLSDKLMNAETKFENDEPMNEDIEFDSDSSFNDYHSENEMLAQALSNSYLAKHTMSFNKNNYFNALRKYFTKRITNPTIPTGAKSILRGYYAPEITQYIEFDPLKKGNRNIEYGEIYLDNAQRQMPVVFRDKQLSLGELWSQYTRAVSKGLSKEDRKAYDDALTFLIIRTPADSVSGTRVVRFRGWSNQRGGGALLHAKDKKYIGGADHDIDSIKIFQGLGPELTEFYRKNKDERARWDTDPDYVNSLNDLFVDKNIPTKLKEGFEDKFNIFSPSYRLLTGMRSSTGKDGLGRGLTAGQHLMSMYDFVNSKGGFFEIKNAKDNGAAVTITLQTKSKEDFLEFLDRKVMVVNKAADASKDPTIIPYNLQPNLLLDKIFTIRKNGNPINADYNQFTRYIAGTKLEAIKNTVRLSKPKQRSADGKTAKDYFEYIKDLNAVRATLENEGLDLIHPAINRELQITFRNGIDYTRINRVQERLFRELKRSYELERSGKLKIRENKKKAEEYLSKHFDIITDELSFRNVNTHRLAMENDPNEGYDTFGKDIGQYATMELLTKQFVDIQNAFYDKGRVVNVVDDVFPKIKEEAFQIKDYVQEIFKNPERDNTMNLDLDGKIRSMMERLQDLERDSGIQDGLLQDYFSYWLLSPIRRNPTPNKPAKPQYYKMLHSSRAIPMRAKKDFYQQMDAIFNRTLEADKGIIELQKPRKLEETIIGNNAKVFDTLDTLVSKNALENIAFTDKDLVEVQKLQETIKTNPAGVDFNNWFINYTNNKGQARDITTMTMDDVKEVNKYLKELDTVEGLPVYLKDWHTSPMTLERKLQKMNFLTRGIKARKAVLTSKGMVDREFVKIMSPIESIRLAVNDMERNINIYDRKALLMRKDLEQSLANISSVPNVRGKYIKELIEYREGRKTLEQLDKSIDQKKFLQLNDSATKFFKDMWQFVAVKDKAGNDFDWSKIDKNKEYGRINNYIKYDKNGKFDLKHFENTVMNAKPTDTIIKTIGIDGLMRYNYEYRLEKLIQSKNPKNPKLFREQQRANKPFFPRRKRNFNTYIHHSIRKVNEKTLLEQAEWLNRQAEKGNLNRLSRDLAMNNPFFDINSRITIGTDYEVAFEQSRGSYASPLKKRGEDSVPFKKDEGLFKDYQDAIIRGYFRNLTKFKAQGDIDAFLDNMQNYKPAPNEAKKFKDLYKGVSLTEIPDNQRYNNYVDVWADFIRTYAETSMGYQTTFSTKQKTPQGRKLLHLNKYNLFYVTSDEVGANQLEKIYKSRFGGKETIPFINKKLIPQDSQARQMFYYNLIRNWGAMEAKYQLMSLLFNTGSFVNNVFGGTTQTAAYAGLENLKDAGNMKVVNNLLLTDQYGVNKVFLNNGKPVKSFKDISEWLEENGFYDNYLQNEFDFNPELTTRLKELGHSFKDFSRDMLTALKSKKGNRDESVSDVLKKYGVSDIMLKTGGFFMQESERINRKKAFLAGALQYIKGTGRLGKNLTLADDQVIEHAMNAIRYSQFFYQNAERPMFMATSTGKVLSRFKLFAFNSVRIRKEFYRQAKELGMKPNTPEFKRLERSVTADLWMYMLAGAFMFSLFDTTLPPPYDWIQSLADYMFGTKKQKEMAYFNDPLGPLSILKPPIARIPEAAGELLTGNWDEFTDYTIYTLLPFGRGIRQAVQLSDDRVGRGMDRAPEILFRVPYNQFINRVERAKSKKKRMDYIEELLENS